MKRIVISMNDERDLQELRCFRDDVGDPSEEFLISTRRQVAEMDDQPRRTWSMPSLFRGRRGWSVAIAGATAVVLATVGVAAMVSPSKKSTAVTGGPGGSVSAEPNGSASAPSEANKPSKQQHETAKNTLAKAAFSVEIASSIPNVTVGQGQALYVKEHGDMGEGPGTYTHEMWVDVEYAFPLKIKRTDKSETFTVPDPKDPKEKQTQEEDFTKQKEALAKNGPSLSMPTAAYVAGLPTDPTVLLEQWRKWVTPDRSWSADYTIFDAVREMLHQTEPMLTPFVRASIYQALGMLDSVYATGETLTLDGRAVVAIAQSERDQTQVILIDAATGKIAGYADSDVKLTKISHYALWSFDVVNRPTN